MNKKGNLFQQNVSLLSVIGNESQSVLLVKVISLNSMKKNFVGNTFHPESTETATEKL